MSARATAVRRFIIGCLMTTTCIGTTATLAVADPNGAPSDANAAAAPIGSAGQRIFLDPNTGARTSTPPPGATVPFASDPALSTSHQGLVEKPAPGGGATVDLQGRFRSAVAATVGPDGTTSVDCHGPGAPAEKE